jgi:hypothetical protein
MGKPAVETQESRKFDDWVSAVLGVDPRTYATSALGGSAHSAPAPDEPGGTDTATLSTAAGDLVYLQSAESNVRPVLQIVASDYDKVQDKNLDLIKMVSTLELLESRYENYDVQDVTDEVTRYTGRSAHQAAGGARGAENLVEGFLKIAAKVTRDLPKAKKQIELAEKDVRIHELGNKVEELKAIKEGVEKILDLAADVVKVATDVKDVGAWIDLAKDLVKDAVDAGFEARIEPLQKEAEKLTDSNLKDRLAEAKENLTDALEDLKGWQHFLDGPAGHDLQVKVEERNDAYDSERKAKKNEGVVRLNELKEGAQLGNELYRLVMDTSGTAHSLHILLVQLQGGNTKAWMGDAAVCNKTIGAMLTFTQSVYREIDPKVNWSKKLGLRFREMYGAAGNAMADKRVAP